MKHKHSNQANDDDNNQQSTAGNSSKAIFFTTNLSSMRMYVHMYTISLPGRSSNDHFCGIDVIIQGYDAQRPMCSRLQGIGGSMLKEMCRHMFRHTKGQAVCVMAHPSECGTLASKRVDDCREEVDAIVKE
eukprot:7125900-Ditylum_brightwellii.AAC.1